MLAQFFANRLRKSFEREFAHAVSAPARETRFRSDRKNIYDARAGWHLTDKTLHQQKRRSDVYPDRLLPFVGRDFAKRFYHRDSGIVDQNIKRIVTNLRNQTG